MTTLSPNLELLSKLGAIAQIVDEAADANAIDLPQARSLLAGRDVSQWLDRMHELGFLARQAAAE